MLSGKPPPLQVAAQEVSGFPVARHDLSLRKRHHFQRLPANSCRMPYLQCLSIDAHDITTKRATAA